MDIALRSAWFVYVETLPKKNSINSISQTVNHQRGSQNYGMRLGKTWYGWPKAITVGRGQASQKIFLTKNSETLFSAFL